MDTNEIADQDDLPLWNFTREMWVGRLDTINCWIGRMVAQKRRKRYRLILRWLLENGATQLRGIELLPDAIAKAIRDQEKWGCSARTVQRAIAFFETAGILARWARCDVLGCPLPPGGRLLWGSVPPVAGTRAGRYYPPGRQPGRPPRRSRECRLGGRFFSPRPSSGGGDGN